MNWFLTVGGFLMLGGAVEALVRRGSYRMAGIYSCYAVANWLLAGAR